MLLQVASVLDTCHVRLFARGLRLEPPAAKSEKVSICSFRITEKSLEGYTSALKVEQDVVDFFQFLSILKKIAWGWPEKQIKLLREQKLPLEYV